MKTSLQQSLGLKQDLRMNPRLYQAMDLLYMPLLDLQQHLKLELETNPFLELAEAEEPESVEQQEAEVTENEHTDEADWEEILLDGFQVGGARPGYEEREFFQPVAVEAHSLGDHLRDQLQMLDLEQRQLFLSEEFIGNIGDDGYLQALLEDIVTGANASREAASERDGDPSLAEPFTLADVLAAVG